MGRLIDEAEAMQATCNSCDEWGRCPALGKSIEEKAEVCKRILAIRRIPNDTRDIVNRQDVKDIVASYISMGHPDDWLIRMINEAKTAQANPLTAYWIPGGGPGKAAHVAKISCCCSNCGWAWKKNQISFFSLCPNCGARITENEETRHTDGESQQQEQKRSTEPSPDTDHQYTAEEIKEYNHMLSEMDRILTTFYANIQKAKGTKTEN